VAEDDRPDPDQALRTYRAKRRFEATPEPAGGGRPDAAHRSFVVQKHWATRLHYDFRLELDGTMKSWAVPKGPSYDPHDKRMAMPTEDHPIAYNRFEGTIPAGNYGAGEVIVWDKGTWVPLEDPQRGLREGKLKFELRGHKLHGHWALVRMKGRGAGRDDPWLLIKERDVWVRPAVDYSVVDERPESVATLGDRPAQPSAPGEERPAAARAAPTSRRRKPQAAAAEEPPAPSGPPAGAVPAPLPAELAPQLATLAAEPPADAAGWLFEIKFDGYRMLARAEGGQVRLLTRNGHDWTARLGALRDALQAMDLPDGWYDGEIIMPGPDGRPSDFQALQNAFDSERTADIVYWLFDLPYCAGQDLRGCTLDDRRAVLRRIVERKPQPRVRFSDAFEAAPQDVVASACRLGLEGVIAKRRDGGYASRRSADWLKLKCVRRQEFVVAGWTDPKGSRTGLGSLVLGVHDADGALQYAGNVGTGFDDRTLAALHARLQALATDRTPLAATTGVPRGVHWVRPQLVAEVAYGEWTREGRVRHAVFQGLREDKPARAITREQAAAGAAAPPPRTRRRAAAAAPAGAAAEPGTLPPGLKVTHPERIVDASTGTSKIALLRYYALVAPLMMEHLRRRPVALVRAPSGIDGQLFFQKHLERYRMPGVEPLPVAVFPGHPAMLEVAEPLGLLSAAQMNVVEFHTWNATADVPDRPDRMTFDLDPGEGATWPQMQQAADLVRAFLAELGLPAWLKTSGGKGLHVVVPLRHEFGWDAVKGFSQAIVQHLARTLPDRFVAKSGPRNRVGRIFIDYLRNGQGATTVCAWSARARPGLGISVPVAWDELRKLRSGAHWTVADVHRRLPVGNGPWDGYAGSVVPLRPAMDRLGWSPE
jgi:bifunctional non-homologous end joining protein LigD